MASVVISVCTWGGLVWLIHIQRRQVKAPIATTTRAIKVTPTNLASPPTNIAEPEPNPAIGSTIIGEDGAVLLYIPEGEFTMGSDVNANEQPVHLVYLNAFWIDQTEVTNEMFSAFIQETGYDTDAEITRWGYTWDGFNWAQTSGADWQHPNGTDSIIGKEKHPVVQISWNDAAAYCQWAGRRLPTEAEWEKAARGTDQRIYPWGNEEPGKSLLNFLNNIGDTTEVGSYPDGASPYGAYDMSGNAWEWVNDWYQGYYYGTLKNHSTNPMGPLYGDGKVIRGGSWINFYNFVRASERRWSNPLFTFSNYGFRCALPLP